LKFILDVKVNLKQLRAFSEVMRTGSVSEAARHLHRTQPAVSAVISSLEEELGLKLFIRQGMRLKPAPEAFFLLKEANEILEKVENAQRTMQGVKKLEKGKLEIVCMPGPSVFLLPDLITRFIGDRKNISVSLLTKSSPEVEQSVSTQNADLGFADYELVEDPESDLVEFEILDFECFCAMHTDDPLSSEHIITPEHLDGQPLATLYADHPTSLQLENAFASTRAVFNSQYQAQFFLSLFAFVEHGVAYSIMDRLSMESYFLQKKQDRTITFRPFRPEITLRTTIIKPAFRPVSLLVEEFHGEFQSMLHSIRKNQP
jgi:DNA-binding transcriptional LysR family regulator